MYANAVLDFILLLSPVVCVYVSWWITHEIDHSDDPTEDMQSLVIFLSLNFILLTAFLTLMYISKTLVVDPGIGFIFVITWFVSIIVGLVNNSTKKWDRNQLKHEEHKAVHQKKSH